MSTNRVPLILDVDTGIDDSLALLYAAASPEAEIVAITALSGNVHVDDTERNTRAILELAGRGDVEVAAGRPVPLLRPLEITPETHGPHGIGWATLPEPERAPSERFAPQLIIDEARKRPGEITLVTLGPLTNLAIAVLVEPELPRLLKRWILMGGTFRAPGNTTPTTEWNIHCDPESAKVCFAAWQAAVDADPSTPRALALGLDVTERARIGVEHVAALAARAGSTPDTSLDAAREPGQAEPRSDASNPVVRFVADALRFYFEFHAQYDGFYGAFIHDPLVVAIALDPSLVETEPAAVDVDVARGLGDGQTIADWRKLWGRAPNVDVAVRGDADEFLRRLIERVGGMAQGRA
ncbi:MAG TPA: nucleoside hydrolase [Candidatus Limnocylindrales bacterium]|nr:nucleoside hydrolase [Candidatus Limnocylindrales bacterium]